jgi:hypothetical protein
MGRRDPSLSLESTLGRENIFNPPDVIFPDQSPDID